MPVGRDDLVEWVANRLVAAEVPVDPSRLYNAYRLLLIREDPAALEQTDLLEYVRPDPALRDSLQVVESYDFPYVTRDNTWLERLAERVPPAEASQLLTARIEPDLVRVEEDLRAFRHVLPRLSKPTTAASASQPSRRRSARFTPAD